MKLFVTGGSGLLGSNLALEFQRAGHRVTATQRRHRVHIPGVSAAVCDLTVSAELSRVLAAARPDCIVHCAAATDVDWCEAHAEESLRINAEVPVAIARLASRLGARMVHISTDAVFDGVAGGYVESDPPCPINQYGRGKALAEAALLREMPDALILRTNLYGWNLQPKKSLAEWVLALLEGNCVVPGFGDVVFSPVLCNNLAGWILNLLDAGRSGIFHVASCDRASKFEFALQLASVFGLNQELVRESSVAESELTARRARNTWLCAGKMAAVTGRRLPSIREGLETFRTLRESGFLQTLKAATA